LQHKCDQSEPPAAILTSLHESRYRFPHFGRGLISQQAAGTLKNLVIAQYPDFWLELLDFAPKPGSERIDVQDGILISIKKHEDIPCQQRPDMALDEFNNWRP